MSVARVSIVKGRKEWKCNSCGRKIAKGEEHRSWSVGFRGATQKRCMDCPAPKTSELESSMVSTVYAAMEDADFDTAGNKEDLDAMIEDIKAAIDEVAGEYESGEMFENNYDLQERVDLLRAAEEELDNWADSLEDEPETEDDEAYEKWLDDAVTAARDAVENLDLP